MIRRSSEAKRRRSQGVRRAGAAHQDVRPGSSPTRKKAIAPGGLRSAS